MKMVLECNPDMVDKTPTFKAPGISLMMTPPIGEEYWMFRVKLSPKQAIIGFPKFGTIGVGFSKETDWNTNLPYTSEAEAIFSHIKHNKGSRKIEDVDCLAAIRLVQEAARETRGK